MCIKLLWWSQCCWIMFHHINPCSIQIGDLLLEVDGKPMIGSSRAEAMHILNDTGESVQ